MTSEKSKTNKKRTSTESFRSNYDRIFSKETRTMCRCELDEEIARKGPDQFWTYYGCPPEQYIPRDCEGCNED